MKCETEEILNTIGAYKGECPWKAYCKRNLSGDECELARTAEGLDSSKIVEVSVIPLPPRGQNLRPRS